MDIEDSELIAYATWSYLIEPGDGVHNALIAELGVTEALSVALGKCPSPRIVGISDTAMKQSISRWQARIDTVSPLADLDLIASLGGEFLPCIHERFPIGFQKLGETQPVGVWVRGRFSPNQMPIVAIVGSRASTRAGEEFAAEISSGIAKYVAVSSGGAFGIDRFAHAGVLSAGGLTYAVLAGGLDRLYPASNQGLFAEILDSGAILSEMPIGARPSRWRFLHRNRLIAAMSELVVVVEAGKRSGALSTARHALALGIEVAAVPGRPYDETSKGTNELIRQGASLIQSVKDIKELLSPFEISNEICTEQQQTLGTGGVILATVLDPLCARVLEALPKYRFAHTGNIANLAGVSATEADTALGLLQLQGKVIRRDGVWGRNR